jgi:hypothetical protein
MFRPDGSHARADTRRNPAETKPNQAADEIPVLGKSLTRQRGSAARARRTTRIQECVDGAVAIECAPRSWGEP